MKITPSWMISATPLLVLAGGLTGWLAGRLMRQSLFSSFDTQKKTARTGQ
jgi:hypothetical protein